MTLPTISPNDAKRLMDEGATLVDIRSVDERAREWIPGSHHGPLAELTNFAGVQAPVIFHCRSGMRTALNAGRLSQAVPCEAYIMEGGLDGWRSAGLPVLKDVSQPIELPRQVMIAAGSLILLSVILGATTSEAFYGLAGFIGAGLVFAGVTGFCGMAKILERMPWNRRPAPPSPVG